MAAGCGDPEDGVGYVKRNAVAGRSFASWEAFEAGGPHAILIAWGGEAHLAAWERDIANARVHGTTGEVPMVRFARDEAAALQPLADRHHFGPAGHWSGGSRTTVPSRSTAKPIRSPSAVC